MVKPSLPDWDTLADDVQRVYNSGWLTKGGYLAEFEQTMAEYLRVSRVVGVANCTIGLLMTYQVLGLRAEVIVPSFTFMATVHPLALLGIEPVFVDVNPYTWNLDPAEVERAITPNTSAIVGVHVFGNPAAIAELEEIAARHGIPVVFDAAHGAGASYRGDRIGGFGAAEVFSMSPTKLLVAGEGGIVATNNEELADSLTLAREYGNDGAYDSVFPGINGRLAEFNAVLALRGIADLNAGASHRREMAARYGSQLGDLPGIAVQQVHPEDLCSYKDFTIRVDEERFGMDRNALQTALRAENIDSRAYYDPPVHRQSAYRHLVDRYRENLPVTDGLAHEVVSLPMWSNMDPQLVDQICEVVHRIHAGAEEIRSAVSRAST
jgi:dTDP-4-amino-4,6-dideoxygalactose transaminase